MAKKKKWTRRDIPHCADPENHVLVETIESVFWRKKRKKGGLNEAFATNVDLSRISGPAARQVVQKLRPFFKGLVTGRITLRISNGLRKALKEKKRMDFSPPAWPGDAKRSPARSIAEDSLHRYKYCGRSRCYYTDGKELCKKA